VATGRTYKSSAIQSRRLRDDRSTVLGGRVVPGDVKERHYEVAVADESGHERPDVPDVDLAVRP
jgi:hypothetical protein